MQWFVRNAEGGSTIKNRVTGQFLLADGDKVIVSDRYAIWDIVVGHPGYFQFVYAAVLVDS